MSSWSKVKLKKMTTLLVARNCSQVNFNRKRNWTELTWRPSGYSGVNKVIDQATIPHYGWRQILAKTIVNIFHFIMRFSLANRKYLVMRVIFWCTNIILTSFSPGSLMILMSLLPHFHRVACWYWWDSFDDLSTAPSIWSEIRKETGR